MGRFVCRQLGKPSVDFGRDGAENVDSAVSVTSLLLLYCLFGAEELARCGSRVAANWFGKSLWKLACVEQQVVRWLDDSPV
jgi:hypothetical protein